MENKKVNKFLMFGLIGFTLLIIILVITKDNEPKYRISTEQTLEQLKKYSENTISAEKVADILFTNDSLYQFIDLRNPREFVKGHLENAINIPLQNILDEQYKSILNQDKKINIIYYSNHRGACPSWMILSQIGYKNNKILLGGYDAVKANIIDNFSPLSGNFKDETPKYDYKKVIKSMSGNSTTNSTASTENAVTVPVIKKEKKAGGGGC